MDNSEILNFIREIELFQELNEEEFYVLSESIEENSSKSTNYFFKENGY